MSDKFLVRDRVLTHLNQVGAVTSRSMFGGFGLYLDGVMFALIAYDILYFKVDDSNRAEFMAAGMQPFTYEGKQKPVVMSYYQLPEAVLADVNALSIWVEKARTAAVQSRAKRKPIKKRSD